MLAPLVDAGVLAPLDDCIAASPFKDRMLASVSYAKFNGKTYGVPLTMSPQSLLYNKAMLDEAGVAVPTTLDEFYAAVKAVKAKDRQLGLRLPQQRLEPAFHLHAVDAVGDRHGQRLVHARPQDHRQCAAHGGGDHLGSNATLDEGLSPRGLDANAARTLFAQGKAAFLFDGPWVMTQVQRTNPALMKDVGYAVMPTPTHAAVTGGAFYTIPAGSKNKPDACAYLGIINAEPAQREWLERLLQIPGTAVQPSPAFLQANRWVGTMAEVAAKYPSGLGYAPPGFAVGAAEFRQIVADHLAQIYAGRTSVKDGLDAAQKALERWAAQR